MQENTPFPEICLPWNWPCPALPAGGRQGLPEDVLLHSRKGFQGRWDDSVVGHHFLLSSPARPAQSRLLIVGAWSPESWILDRDPLGFEKAQSSTTTQSHWLWHWELRLGDHSHALECSQGMAKPALQGHQVFGTQQWSVCQWLLTLLPELLNLFLSNHLALKAIFYSSVILLSEVKSISRAVGVSLLWFIHPFHICKDKQTQFSKHLCYPLTAFPCKIVLVPEPGRKGKVSLMKPTSHSHPPTIRHCVLHLIRALEIRGTQPNFGLECIQIGFMLIFANSFSEEQDISQASHLLGFSRQWSGTDAVISTAQGWGQRQNHKYSA